MWLSVVVILLLMAHVSPSIGASPQVAQRPKADMAVPSNAFPYGSVQLGCKPSGDPQRLTLSGAISLALCSDPRTRKAWAEIVGKAAELKIADAGYWPDVSTTLTAGFRRNKLSVEGLSFDDSDTNQKGYTASLDLNWTLFDFGLTRSKSRAAHWALVQAAKARTSAVQSVIVDASQAFFDVLDAEAAVGADREAETYARESLDSAEGRYAAGAAVVTDVLQARTAYSAARVKRISAEGQWRDALGALRVAIGQEANSDVYADDSDQPVPTVTSLAAVDRLINEARQSNPDLQAARAAAEAAYANVAVARAQDMPTLALVGSTKEDVERSDSAKAFTGFLSLPAANTTHDRGIQLKLTIPLFSGFSYQAGIEAARAQAVEASAALQDSERQLTLQVWKASDAIHTEVENYGAASEFLSDAKQSYEAARARYQAGVGTVLDMLNSQSDISNATQQRIEAVSRWRIARLKLAAALGRLQ